MLPQTPRTIQNQNKLKLVSKLGSALGWSKADTAQAPTENTFVSGIYNMSSAPKTQAEKDDFRQKLLEMRLNDTAQKYCKEKNVSPIAVRVVRVNVTGAKQADGNFIPVFASEALNGQNLQSGKLFMAADNLPGLIKIYVFAADTEKMKENAVEYQDELNRVYNNTPALEKTLRRELWRHVLLDRCRQKGLVMSDLSGLDVIQIIQVHDAFIKSGLLEELIEERARYLAKSDLGLIDDKFSLYKHALRDRIIKPAKGMPSNSELALMADCVQDLFNARADSYYMESRIKTVVFCRRPTFTSGKTPDSPAGKNFDTFMKFCSEHDIGGERTNFMFRQSKEDHISQSTIETIKRLDRNLFTKRDEEAVKNYFRYDKKELQATIDEVKNSILKFYKNKEYLK